MSNDLQSGPSRGPIPLDEGQCLEDCEPPECKTPYQGKRRTYGLFRCTACNNKWSSGNSWANMGQQCRRCLAMIYPFAQFPLQRLNKPTTARREHPEELCEMCIKLGRKCKTETENTQTNEQKKKKKKKRNKRKNTTSSVVQSLEH